MNKIVHDTQQKHLNSCTTQRIPASTVEELKNLSITMNMSQSTDHEHIDFAQLIAKIETSPTTNKGGEDVPQHADSLATVEPGQIDAEIAEIRSEGVKVDPEDGRIVNFVWF